MVQKILTLTMNSVVDLMREVEQKEKVAEQIKEQSNRDCSDIYSKVDEIKQTLQQAKEANDMVFFFSLVQCHFYLLPFTSKAVTNTFFEFN